MKYLTTALAAAFMVCIFALIQPVHAREAFEEPDNCEDYWQEGERQNCRKRQRYLESQQAEIDALEPVEQFADKEDGADAGGESGGGDNGGGDKAAASTAAE